MFDYATRYGEAIERLAQWIRDAEATSRIAKDVLEGELEQAPGSGSPGLYRGENLGKRLIRIASLSRAQTEPHPGATRAPGHAADSGQRRALAAAPGRESAGAPDALATARRSWAP